MDKFSIIVRFDRGILKDVPRQAQLTFWLFLSLLNIPKVWGIRINNVATLENNKKDPDRKKTPKLNSIKGYIIPNLKNFFVIGS